MGKIPYCWPSRPRFVSFPSRPTFRIVSKSKHTGKYALVLPEALPRKSDGKPAWNATKECCRNEDEVDDSKYIQNLVTRALTHEAIDDQKIFIAGHSNGGFMAYRLACDTDGMFEASLAWRERELAIPVAARRKQPSTYCRYTEPKTALYRIPQRVRTTQRLRIWWQGGLKRNNCKDFSKKENDQNLLLLTINQTSMKTTPHTLRGAFSI